MLCCKVVKFSIIGVFSIVWLWWNDPSCCCILNLLLRNAATVSVAILNSLLNFTQGSLSEDLKVILSYLTGLFLVASLFPPLSIVIMFASLTNGPFFCACIILIPSSSISGKWLIFFFKMSCIFLKSIFIYTWCLHFHRKTLINYEVKSTSLQKFLKIKILCACPFFIQMMKHFQHVEGAHLFFMQLEIYLIETNVLSII